MKNKLLYATFLLDKKRSGKKLIILVILINEIYNIELRKKTINQKGE
jgi:hypothetical protein